MFHNVKTPVPVEQIDQPALIDIDIVGRRRWLIADRFGNVVGNFDRQIRIGHVDNPQAA